MTLEIEASKSMTHAKKHLIESGQMAKKLKRIFEVLSVICSTASVNIVIACLYDCIPDILGYKSQEMLFDFAFSLLVASVISYVLAMATSRIQNMKTKISFSAPKILKPNSSLLKSFFCFKTEDIVGYEKFSIPASTHPVLSHAESIENSEEKRNNLEYLNSLDNVSGKNSEHVESFKNAEKNTLFSLRSDESSEMKSIPQSQACCTPIKFGNCSETHSPNFIKSRKLKLFDLQRIDKKSQLLPHLQQTVSTDGHLNKVNTRNISNKQVKVGIVSPIKMNNSSNVKYWDLQKKNSPSVEGIQTRQKFIKKSFKPINLLEQQGFNQITDRMSNAVDNNIPYESNLSEKSFLKLHDSQRGKVFNNRLHTTHKQNLHEVQNIFPKINRHDGCEASYRKLQTMPEMSDNFSSKISKIGRFSFHNLQEVNPGNHCFELHRKDTQNFKSFQNLLRDSDETTHSKMEKNNTHYGWNRNLRDWGENFVDRPDIPMEISNTAPNDQVLEVSMKLKDLNFIF